LSPDQKLVELVEYADHPWFVGCQFHPEFKSRPMDSHPLFASYIEACLKYKNRKAAGETESPQARGKQPKLEVVRRPKSRSKRV
ncbi:MAG: hypothetical protein HY912_14810, partial [Desulfomonile tiedjei]|nr:hypothetical protein [Desulfomonile tiedjei]